MEPIAIIGLGCRFPGAENPEAFWQLLRDGVDAITEIPSERWDPDAFYDSEVGKPGKMNTRWGGFLKEIDQFEPSFFGISPREAERIDPQQRLLLEVAWEAIENAGIAPESLAGSRTGVVTGISTQNYSLITFQDHKLTQINAYDGTGNSACIAANRISYVLNLRGPSFAIDTACSSSLVAVHQACQSLRTQESDLYIVGAANAILSPAPNIQLSQAYMMASDGRCKTFDASANGYVRGEGCGVVILKRLSDALSNKDHIKAVIRGSAINQDGLSNGLTAPNGPAQQALIREALNNAGVEPAKISYVEAHGTGTSLGDPIEVKALKTVLKEERSCNQPLWIGSVKTNIGHLEAAAGMASLIKVVLSLQRQQIPPHLHLKQLNPYISLKGTPFHIPTECQPWSVSPEPRLAGVSAFSYGGTNAHVIVEEAPLVTESHSPSRQFPEQQQERPLHLLALSAKSKESLRKLAQKYQDFLSCQDESYLPNIGFTANTGRSHFEHRLAVVAETIPQVKEQLATFVNEKENSATITGQVTSQKKPKIAFLFTGQGSQYLGMGQQLYETQPSFRQALDQCSDILQPHIEKSLVEVLYSQSQTDLLDQTAYTQPALFALEYALYQLWKYWGVEPTAVMGHSVGEYVAACVAGVFSLEDGLKLIAHRARLMQSLPAGGEMVAVLATKEQISQVLQPYQQEVAIAALNGPQSVVISGATAAIQEVCQSLEAQGLKTKKLTVSHAFHSPLMEPMLKEFEEVAQTVTYSAPRLKLLSNLRGSLAGEEIATAKYWVEHIQQPVQFQTSMKILEEQGYQIFLEVGPKPTLLGMASQCVSGTEIDWLPSLRPGKEDWEQMLESLALLYIRGVKVDWQGLDRDYPRRRIALPTYPWQRQRYWIESSEAGDYPPRFSSSQTRNKRHHPLLGQRLPSALEAVQFESNLSQVSPNFLKDHCVYQQILLPATGYLEMALAAGARVFKSEKLRLEDVAIKQALVLAADEEKIVQFILFPESSKAAAFKLFSLTTNQEDEEPNWMLHAMGKVLMDEPNPDPHPVDWPTLQNQALEAVSVTEHYQKLQERGINYGSSFQAIKKIWKHESQIWGHIKLPESLALEAEHYQLHPVLLDACFQLLGTAYPQDSQDAYLPMKLEGLQVYCRPSHDLWCQLEIPQFEKVNQKFLQANFTLFDATGTIIAEVKGLAVKRLNRKAFLRIFQKDLDQVLNAGAEKRQQLLQDYFSKLLTKVTGIAAAEIDWQQQLSTLGLDSLMAAELRKQIETDLGVAVPVEFFAGLNIAQFLTQVRLLVEEKSAVGHSRENSTFKVSENEIYSEETSAVPTRWVNRSQKPNPSLRLFCFPAAGAGASMFRSWSQDLPSHIEVCSIQLPGKENRVQESPFTQLKPLIQDLASSIKSYLDLPFAFFGHSMGAWLSFELAREFRRRSWSMPSHLFVASRGAPHRMDLKPPIYRLPDLQFIEALRSYEGIPEEVLQDSELMQLFLPALRADFQVIETYFYGHESPLECPITAFGGLQDSQVSREELVAWKEQTQNKFNLQIFPGNHFFLHSARKSLLQVITREMQNLLMFTIS